MNSNQTNNITMDAKMKAQELVDRFKQNQILAISNTKGNMVYPYISGVVGNKVMDHQAKQCALICVDEIISQLKRFGFTMGGVGSAIKFYNEVKQEIEKL